MTVGDLRYGNWPCTQHRTRTRAGTRTRTRTAQDNSKHEEREHGKRGILRLVPVRFIYSTIYISTVSVVIYSTIYLSIVCIAIYNKNNDRRPTQMRLFNGWRWVMARKAIGGLLPFLSIDGGGQAIVAPPARLFHFCCWSRATGVLHKAWQALAAVKNGFDGLVVVCSCLALVPNGIVVSIAAWALFLFMVFRSLDPLFGPHPVLF